MVLHRRDTASRRRKRRLIRHISDHIRGLIERSGWDVCWLAADKEMNQKILDELSPAACNRIKKSPARLDQGRAEGIA
jgi:hypothetical protein